MLRDKRPSTRAPATAVATLALFVSSCLSSYGYEPGEHESLVAAIETAERILVAELDRVFGDYQIVTEEASVFRCEPLEAFQGAYSVTIVVAGLDRSSAYDQLIDGQPGLFEVNPTIIPDSPDRSAGFAIDGLAEQVAVFDYEGSDLRVAANTGCYDQDSWGVKDPRSLEWERP